MDRTKANMVKVLRATRFELDPTVSGPVRAPGSARVCYSSLDVMEVELPDGAVKVYTTSTPVPETVPDGIELGELWWSSGRSFEETVKINETKERTMGAVLSGPHVTVAEGEPVMREMPAIKPVTLKRNV